MTTTIIKTLHAPQDLIIDLAQLLNQPQLTVVLRGGNQRHSTLTIEVQQNGTGNGQTAKLLSQAEQLISDYYDFLSGAEIEFSHYLPDEQH
jgi:hypothetical protein